MAGKITISGFSLCIVMNAFHWNKVFSANMPVAKFEIVIIVHTLGCCTISVCRLPCSWHLTEKELKVIFCANILYACG